MTIPNFDGVPGVIFKRFCTFCSNEADGDFEVQDECAGLLKIPVCESCVAGITKKYGVDTE